MRPRLLAALLASAAGLAAGEALGAAGDVPQISRRAEAYQLYARAQLLMFERQDEAAVDLLEQAVQRDPDPALLLETARAHALLGGHERALTLARWALRLRPGWSQAWSLQGDLHLDQAQAGKDVAAHLEDAMTAYREALAADPGDGVTTRALADLYMQTGRLQEAEDLLSSYASGRSAGPGLGILLARAQMRAGHPEKAEPILRAIVARTPTYLEAVDTLASLYESSGRLDEAIALYAPALEAGDVSSGLLDRLGLLHLEAGHMAEAIVWLEKARLIDPDDRRRLLPLAQAYEAQGSLDRAATICEQAIAADPEQIESRFQHARLLRKQGNAAAARLGYAEVVRMGEGRENLSEREATILVLASAQMGVLAMEANQNEAAAIDLARAVRLDDGRRPDLAVLLARAQIGSGDLAGAEGTIAEASRRFPDEFEVRIVPGEILLARGDTAGARTLFESLLRSAGESIEAYVEVGDALMRSRRYDEAESLLGAGLARHKDDDRLLFARGAALERLGRLVPAEQSLARAVEVNPHNAMALNYLGFMLADRGQRLLDSVSYVERALALDPDNPAYLDSLGWALFKLARYAPAEEKLRTALRYDGSNPAIREHLGDLLVATGRTEEAVREWNAALACGHDEPERIRQKLARAQDRLSAGR